MSKTAGSESIRSLRCLSAHADSPPLHRGAHYVQPRSRNSTNNIGIGMPSNQSKTHPTAPRSVLRITILHFIQAYSLKENVKKTSAECRRRITGPRLPPLSVLPPVWARVLTPAPLPCRRSPLLLPAQRSPWRVHARSDLLYGQKSAGSRP